MVCIIWNGFLLGMGWVSTRLFTDPRLLDIAVISCLQTSTSRGQAARSTLLYCQEQGTYWVRMVSSRLYLALGPNCYWTCSAVHYMKRDGLGLTSELRSFVNVEVGLGSHFLSHSSACLINRKVSANVKHCGLLLCGLKHVKHCGLKHCGLKD